MRRSKIPSGAVLFTGVLLAFSTIAASAPRAPKPGAVSTHVVVISIDGLRPDAIARYNAKTLLRMQREGAVAGHAETVFPSKTLPSHTSMLTGVTPDVHGITWNSDKTDDYGYVQETVFEIAKRDGFTTAAFFSKTKFHHLQKPGSLDYTQAPSGTNWMATKTVADVKQYLQFERPNLLFVHIGEPDFAGHSIGWMSFAYGWAVKRADAAVEAIIEAADEAYGTGNYTVIVTADHGGHGRHHGTKEASDMTIPWFAWGRGVEPGTFADVKTTDTAATILWLLGVAPPTHWSGKAVASAFTTGAQLAAANAILAPAATD